MKIFLSAAWLANFLCHGISTTKYSAHENSFSLEKYPKYEITHTEQVADSEWLILNKTTYRYPPDTKEYFWDVVSKKHTGVDKGKHIADAVVILPLLANDPKSKTMDKEVLVIKQFRPPLERLSIELPGGIIDQGEDAGKAALRELHEETGYIGTVRSVSPVLSSSPGMSSGTTQVVVVDVDMNLQENKNVIPQPEENERIEVRKVKLSEYVKHLETYPEDVVQKGLYFLALGILIGGGQMD